MHQPDMLFGHQLCGGLIHEVTVLDALDARGDRPLNRLGRVGMNGDVGVPVLSRFDGGVQLGLGECRDVQRAMRRGHAPACHQLDLRRAQHELLADPQANLVGTVGDHGGADLLDARIADRPPFAAACKVRGSRRVRPSW